MIADHPTRSGRPRPLRWLAAFLASGLTAIGGIALVGGLPNAQLAIAAGGLHEAVLPPRGESAADRVCHSCGTDESVRLLNGPSTTGAPAAASPTTDRTSPSRRYQVRVRFDDGRQRDFIESIGPWPVGARVRLASGDLYPAPR